MPIDQVIFYQKELKYGFIRAAPCNVFFHRSAVDGQIPEAGDVVRYEAEPAGKSSPRATMVRVLDPAVIAEADRVFGSL